jgi:hypothetical protein
MFDYYVHTYVHRAIQEERAILWELLVSVVVRKVILYDYVYLVIIIIIIIIIIIFINCNWVDTRWQWLFYMYTKYDIGCY